MASLDPSRSRKLLLAWLVAIFAFSAITDLRVLALLGIALPLVFRRGALCAGRTIARSVLPWTVVLVAASWGWLWLVEGRRPEIVPYAALTLRTLLIAFTTFSVLERVSLLRALAPWPAASRLLVVTLAQIHSLRLLATESRQGLSSRLLRKPGAMDVVRNAGGITGALVTLSTRNARDIADALRSRGF